MKMPDTPGLVSLELTKRCNLACKHRRVDAGAVDCSGELAPAEVQRVLGDSADFVNPIAVLSGGEPLDREDIFDIARSASYKNKRVRALRTYAEPWAPDPQCYLTDEEIGIDEAKRQELRASGEDFAQPEELLA